MSSLIFKTEFFYPLTYGFAVWWIKPDTTKPGERKAVIIYRVELVCLYRLVRNLAACRIKVYYSENISCEGNEFGRCVPFFAAASEMYVEVR